MLVVYTHVIMDNHSMKPETFYEYYMHTIMKYRWWVFGGFIGFIILLLVIIYLLTDRKTIEPPDGLIQPTFSPTEIIITPISADILPTAPPTPVPEEGDMIITGIAVNDFTKDADKILLNGDVVIKEMETYQIVYLNKYQSFIISVLDSDFERALAAAERDFLAILGIDEPNACRLTVQVSSPAFAQNEYAGVSFPLSFCQDHADDNSH